MTPSPSSRLGELAERAREEAARLLNPRPDDFNMWNPCLSNTRILASADATRELCDAIPSLLERISSLEGALEERDRKIERFKSRDVQWRSLVASLVAEAQRNHGGDLIDLLHNAAIQAQEALSEPEEGDR